MNIPYRKKKTAEGRFVEVRGRFFRPLTENSVNGREATGELEVEFKFQRCSCMLSFLFLPRCQSAPESLLPGSYPGYKTANRHKVAIVTNYPWIYASRLFNIICLYVM